MEKGLTAHPSDLIVTPQNESSAMLSWSPPVVDNNCSFCYVVNSQINGSLVVQQHRTNITTSLVVTGLTIATIYQFAVAVEDTVLTTGPWSEMVNILWDGKWFSNKVI